MFYRFKRELYDRWRKRFPDIPASLTNRFRRYGYDLRKIAYSGRVLSVQQVDEVFERELVGYDSVVLRLTLKNMLMQAKLMDEGAVGPHSWAFKHKIWKNGRLLSQPTLHQIYWKRMKERYNKIHSTVQDWLEVTKKYVMSKA